MKTADHPLIRAWGRLYKSIWLFPAVLGLLFGIFTALQVSGTSIGVYKTYFGLQDDPALLFGRPLAIRSDEWVVKTQMTLAQVTNGLERTNTNIGDGADMSVLVDAPYKEWSALFRPHLFGFFVMPAENAFAFKWWSMAFLLMTSCYFFVLTVLPGRRMWAALLAVALFFSPFVQWWYQIDTLGPLFYSLFAITTAVLLLRAEKLSHMLWLGAGLTYALICFALVLYPPFQIPCAIVGAAYVLGVLLSRWRQAPKLQLRRSLLVIAGAILVTGAVVGMFVLTRMDTVKAIANTAYPGARVVQSGGFDVPHLFSGQMAAQFQWFNKANAYQIPQNGLTNQSESSNFILPVLFLIVPGLVILWRDRRANKAIDWPLLAMTATLLLFLAWLFVPHLDILGKITLLDKVPLTRLLIGIGLINFIYIALLIRRFTTRSTPFKPKWALVFAVLVLIALVAVDLVAATRFPLFISPARALLAALPVPIVIYLLLRRQTTWALTVLAGFTVVSTLFVNPLYRGLGIVTETPLSKIIQTISAQDPSYRWVAESAVLENFAQINGARSLTGLYAYPQLELWQGTGADPAVYNRYAHTNVVLDRAPEQTPTTLELSIADHFGIYTEPCSDFLKSHDVRYIIAELPITDACVKPVQTVDYPARRYTIYAIQ